MSMSCDSMEGLTRAGGGGGRARAGGGGGRVRAGTGAGTKAGEQGSPRMMERSTENGQYSRSSGASIEAKCSNSSSR